MKEQMKYLAKPRVANMLDAKEFKDITLAVKYLNEYTINCPSGEPQIKMVAKDWMEIGKLVEIK
jgi:hypothetical protein